MRALIVGMLVFVFLAASYSEFRIWTGTNGQTFEAEYMQDASGKVWLKPATGKVRTVPINALTKKDQDYINIQTLPKIEVEVDDDIKRSSVGSDIDNVLAKIRCTIEIKKTSARPYPAEYEVMFFVLGMDINSKEYFIADSKVEFFSLLNKNDTFSFKGKDLSFEYDPSPARGNRYEGYALCVKTSDGITLVTKGPDKFTRHLDKLKEGKERSTRYTKDFSLSGRSRR